MASCFGGQGHSWVQTSSCAPAVLAGKWDSQIPLQQLLKSQSQSHSMQGDFLPSPPPHSHYFPPSPGADSTGPSPVTLCSAAIVPRRSRASGLPPGASLPGPLAASCAVHVLISPKELGAAELGTYLMQREGAATLQQPAGCHHQGPSTRTYLWDQEPDLSSKSSLGTFLTVTLQFSQVLHPHGPCAVWLPQPFLLLSLLQSCMCCQH